jgi:hypothetical protein
LEPKYLWWVVGAFIVIGLVYVLPFFGAVNSEARFNAKLLAEGKCGEAEILGYSVGDVWVVKYRFTPEGFDGPIECSKPLSAFAERFPIGTTVKVRYLAQHPSLSILEPYIGAQSS